MDRQAPPLRFPPRLIPPFQARLRRGAVFTLAFGVAGAVALAAVLFVQNGSGTAVLRFALPEHGNARELPVVAGPADSGLPLIVIDAGHGGYDPGAVYTGQKGARAQASGIEEKALVLALARALRDELIWDGGVRVALTRDADRFLALDERVAIASALGADLFLSIHADSDGGVGASGGTIYTLSHRASSAAAARFAVRENRADAVKGVSVSGSAGSAGIEGDARTKTDTNPETDAGSGTEDARQRKTDAASLAFARAIEREGQGQLQLRPYPLRSADLRVLQASDVPSVLYEAGFISHGEDVMRLASPAGRAAVAEGLARAVRAHFSAPAAKK